MKCINFDISEVPYNGYCNSKTFLAKKFAFIKLSTRVRIIVKIVPGGGCVFDTDKSVTNKKKELCSSSVFVNDR